MVRRNLGLPHRLISKNFNCVIWVKANKPFTALNFWGYAGIGKNNPNNGKWNLGDDYTADPPQEPQGLNSVFSSDKETLELIKKYNDLLKNN